MKGASAVPASAPFMQVIFILVRLQSVARPAAFPPNQNRRLSFSFNLLPEAMFFVTIELLLNDHINLSVKEAFLYCSQPLSHPVQKLMTLPSRRFNTLNRKANLIKVAIQRHWDTLEIGQTSKAAV